MSAEKEAELRDLESGGVGSADDDKVVGKAAVDGDAVVVK